MTDTRELLELAANACGLKIDKSETGGGGQGNTGFDVLGNAVLDWHDNVTWNPLTNPGDCADMEEKLSINVLWWDDRGYVSCSSPDGAFAASEYFSDHPNRQAARMMASTRCAAEVARRM